jgi:hypothetical protein
MPAAISQSEATRALNKPFTSVEDNLAEVEALIDAYGLFGLMECIEMVCHEKADHLNSNWQDETAAKEWTRAAKVIETATKRLCAVTAL